MFKEKIIKILKFKNLWSIKNFKNLLMKENFFKFFHSESILGINLIDNPKINGDPC